MQDHEIKCPQPVRPLKRTGEHLDLVDHTPFKRQSFEREPSYFLQRWLAELQTPFNRDQSRSDSFLFTKMVDKNLTPSRRSAQSTDGQPGRHTKTPDSFVDFPEASTRSRPPSRATEVETNADAKTSSRIRGSGYREDLEQLGVFIYRLGRNIPPELKAHAENVLEKERLSPGLLGPEIKSIIEELEDNVNSDEATVRDTFASTKLMPSKTDYKGKFVVGGDTVFNRRALPHNPADTTNKFGIVNPKPDKQYSYPLKGFSKEEQQVMQHERVAPFAKPTSTGRWPFFVVEYKSESRGGTSYVAENQNAGTGTHCVNSLETLFKYTEGNEKRTIINSAMFSCVAMVTGAVIWVHWRAVGPDGRFASSPVGFYNFQQPNDVKKFRNSVRNIIDHGLDERMNSIKAALNELFPGLSTWDAEDAKAKKQKALDAQAAKLRQASDVDATDTAASGSKKKARTG